MNLSACSDDSVHSPSTFSRGRAGDLLDGISLGKHMSMLVTMFPIPGLIRQGELVRIVRCAAGVLLQTALQLAEVRAAPQDFPNALGLAGIPGCCA